MKLNEILFCVSGVALLWYIVWDAQSIGVYLFHKKSKKRRRSKG